MLANSSNCEDEALRTKYEGIAYFFRAYFYFQKVMRFGDVPYYDKVLESTDTEFLNKARDDRGFVMDKVMEDFDKAIEMIPATKDAYSARVTKWVALAMKSRAALFEGTWRKYHGMPDAEKYLQRQRHSSMRADTSFTTRARNLIVTSSAATRLRLRKLCSHVFSSSRL